jgi:dienelactone hydrolase
MSQEVNAATRIHRRHRGAALLVALCLGTSVACHAQQQSAPPAERVEIPVSPLPFMLQGLLRRPEGVERAAAIILLPACGGFAKSLDEDWATRLSSWGYVTLTIDSLGSRGITDCGDSVLTGASDLAADAYRALDFLVQKRFIDPKRAAVVGFAWGGWQALAAVERGATEQVSGRKFRGAAAFYPPCGYFKGIMTVPTLILVGERDDWVTADSCRRMAAGEDDVGISRHKGDGVPVRLIVYPGAHFAFDLAALETPIEILGHHLEFNKPAADQSSDALREFLGTTIGGRQ